MYEAFKRYRLTAVASFAFEHFTVYQKDFRTIDQVIKCASGFSKEVVTFKVFDRLFDRDIDVYDIVDQFREE